MSKCFQKLIFRTVSNSIFKFSTGNDKLSRLIPYPRPRNKIIRSRQVRQISFLPGFSRIDDWNRAVSEAEKIVGYPTSFMSLRCLLSDELSNVALQMRKLVGTKHPLLTAARTLFYDGKHDMQTRGLLVLLISKAAGPCQRSVLSTRETMISGIYPSQRTLAEITEMIHTAHLIHKGVVNLDAVQPSNGSVNDMEIGNKMAVLSGDFLLANASTGLASLQNTEVVEIISSAIGDLVRAEFSKLRDYNGQSCLPPEGATIEDWEEQTFLSSGGLIAKSCQSALLLANHSDDLQKKAYQFGKHTAYAHQIHEDLQFYVGKGDEEICNVTSSPVLLHLADHSPDSSFLELLRSPKKSSVNQVRNILNESGAINKAQELCRTHSSKALDALNSFENSPSKTALQNIVHAVTS